MIKEKYCPINEFNKCRKGFCAWWNDNIDECGMSNISQKQIDKQIEDKSKSFSKEYIREVIKTIYRIDVKDKKERSIFTISDVGYNHLSTSFWIGKDLGEYGFNFPLANNSLFLFFKKLINTSLTNNTAPIIYDYNGYILINEHKFSCDIDCIIEDVSTDVQNRAVIKLTS